MIFICVILPLQTDTFKLYNNEKNTAHFIDVKRHKRHAQPVGTKILSRLPYGIRFSNKLPNVIFKQLFVCIFRQFIYREL